MTPEFVNFNNKLHEFFNNILPLSFGFLKNDGYLIKSADDPS